jgi:hypothetical protein
MVIIIEEMEETWKLTITGTAFPWYNLYQTTFPW